MFSTMLLSLLFLIILSSILTYYVVVLTVFLLWKMISCVHIALYLLYLPRILMISMFALLSHLKKKKGGEGTPSVMGETEQFLTLSCFSFVQEHDLVYVCCDIEYIHYIVIIMRYIKIKRCIFKISCKCSVVYVNNWSLILVSCCAILAAFSSKTAKCFHYSDIPYFNTQWYIIHSLNTSESFQCCFYSWGERGSFTIWRIKGNCFHIESQNILTWKGLKRNISNIKSRTWLCKGLPKN